MGIAGYILAGGQNRRMNHGKKLFLTYEGKTFLDYVLAAFESQTYIKKVYLSVECPGPYTHLKLPLVVDQYSAIGPMGAIATGLKTCGEEALLVLPCDTPGITPAVTELLWNRYKQSGRSVTAAREGRLHPLTGIYRKADLPVMDALIKEGNYRMMEFLTRISSETVKIDDEQALCNINSLQEYKEWTERRKKSGE